MARTQMTGGEALWVRANIVGEKILAQSLALHAHPLFSHI